MSDQDFWSMRYQAEGEIWLNNPSLTALFLDKVMLGKASIFEIGFGYGRDIIHLAQKGYSVSGIEKSSVGLHMAQEKIKSLVLHHSPVLIHDDFFKASIPEQTFDAVYSHRVSHLFTTPEEVKAFEEKLSRIVKPDGFLFISARDLRGGKPNRKGHHIQLWNEEYFTAIFQDNFEIKNFIQGEELESASNPVPTYFTLMVAQRKLEIS